MFYKSIYSIIIVLLQSKTIGIETSSSRVRWRETILKCNFKCYFKIKKIFLHIYHFKKSNKLRYGRPVSEPGSPSASRSSTPHLFSDDDDDDTETDDDGDSEIRRINSSSNNSEKSFGGKNTGKSVEQTLRDLQIKSSNE